MSVAREDVIWAYRMLLGRDPESDTVVDLHAQVDDRGTLRSAFMSSTEFEQAIAATRPPTVGRYQDVATLPIEPDCTPAELDHMLRHIAAEWRRYGETVPHWSVLTNEEFLPDRIEETVDHFYMTGHGQVGVMLAALNRAGLPADGFGRAMDFGCGVGRLTLALADRAHEVTGVDISPPHLAIARERAGARSNVTFSTLTEIDDLDRLGSFDLIISLIVLQHNPPPVIAALLRKLLSRLASGGCIVIQIPTYIHDYAFSVAHYLEKPNPGINANPLPQHVIFSIFAEMGCDMLEVREDAALGHLALSHTFTARRR